MMELSVTSCVLLLLFVFAAAGENAKRQVHHTQSPHTPLPSGSPDPLAAWMSSTSSSKPNVLFLIADDLRPKLGCYGDSNMVTPNLDHLASKSVMFKQAFAQVALCGPSRASFLTGRRPDTTRVYDLHTYWRDVAGNFTTLPQFFKNHGYHSQGVGKIFHPGASSGNDDHLYSWSSDSYPGVDPFDRTQHHVAAVHPVNESETGKLQDTTIADYAVNFLKEHAHNRDQPFFLAVGFHKPHLPWVFPKEYLDLYPLTNIHLAEHRTRPTEMPDIAFAKFQEILAYQDVAQHVTADQLIADDYHKTLRQAYSAAVSYMDAQLGRVLQALTQNGFAQNTIVSFLGDHGWQLGENAEWCKHTDFDMAIRIPMMVHVPGVTSVYSGHFGFIDPLTLARNATPVTPGPQHATDELVEALDLYPTLAQLSGLPVPPTCPHPSLTVATCSEGTSLVPLIQQVRGLGNSSGHMQWKQAAFSQYQRGKAGPHSAMGYTVRTATHRYTEWVYYDYSLHQPDFSQVKARELYDHTNDQFEFHNLAEVTSHSAKVAELSGILRGGWRKTHDDYVKTLGR